MIGISRVARRVWNLTLLVITAITAYILLLFILLVLGIITPLLFILLLVLGVPLVVVLVFLAIPIAVLGLLIPLTILLAFMLILHFLLTLTLSLVFTVIILWVANTAFIEVLGIHLLPLKEGGSIVWWRSAIAILLFLSIYVIVSRAILGLKRRDTGRRAWRGHVWQA